MAQQTINIGTTANDGTGTPIRDSFDIVNDNFTEVYGKPDLSLVTNTLTLTKADGTTDTVDLAPYLDEDARAISSGTIDGSGIVTFTRDDATTFTLDLSSLLDNTNLVTSVAGKTGVVTLVKGDVGLGNVDNTSDANKPVSTAGQTALNLKYDASNPAGYTSNAAANNATITLTAGNGLSGGGTFTTDQSGVGEITFTVGVDDSTTELADDQVRVKDLGITTAKLAADAVDGTKIADDSIDSEHYVDGSIDTAHIADDQITHDKLEARYTVEVTKTDTSGTGGSAVTLDWSAGAIFHFSNSLTGAIELKFDEYKANQAIDIYGLTGSQTVTLNSTASGTEVFKRIGTQEYDGTADNHIQVICLDDSASTPVFHYAIGTTTSTATA
jgi:hypothetical protein